MLGPLSPIPTTPTLNLGDSDNAPPITPPTTPPLPDDWFGDQSNSPEPLPLAGRGTLGDPNNLPPLHKACKQGRLENIDALLADDATDVNALDSAGRNVLMYAFHRAIKYQDSEPLFRLIHSGKIYDWTVHLGHDSGICVPLLHHAFLNRRELPKDLPTQLLSNSVIPVNFRDSAGYTLLDLLTISATSDAEPWLAALLVRPDLRIAPENECSTHPLILAVRVDNLHAVMRLLERHDVNANPPSLEPGDLVFEYILHAVYSQHSQLFSLIVAYLNNPSAQLSHVSEDGSISDRMAQFDTWNPEPWVNQVLRNLFPEALKRICQPLISRPDTELTELFLASPQQVCAALLVDEPGYRGRLLANINSLMAPLGEDFQWWYDDADGLQRLTWLSHTLYAIKPQGQPFHTWLNSIKVMPTTIQILVSKLPDVLGQPLLGKIREQAVRLLSTHHVNVYRRKRQRLRATPPSDQACKLLRAQTESALSEVRLIAAFEPSDEMNKTRRRIVEFLALIPQAFRLNEAARSSQPQPERDELLETDIATLLIPCVPPEHSWNFLAWLHEKLGHELHVLFERGIRIGKDLEDHLGISLEQMATPTEEQREEILNKLKAFLNNADTAPGSSSS